MFPEIGAVLVVVLLGWAYRATQPPPPKICGSPHGPPVTSPRIRLSDGRYLAYKERGAPKEKSKYKIIIVHGFDSSKDLNLPAPQEIVEDLRLYFLLFDRAGYGESDPNPKRSVKSEAYDIQELADQLQIGLRFYVMGISMGGYPVWSCLKYIPHRLAGAALVVPAVNYWWPSLPANLSRAALSKHLVQDQWAFKVTHYAPWLLHWWMTQKWFPSLSITQGNMAIFSPHDLEVLHKYGATMITDQDKIRQQGVYESLHRDLMVAFGDWGFDPLELTNPFPHNESSVHLWQGCEDRIIPYEIQRYVAKKLPWIQYHEVPNGGHLFPFDPIFCEGILRTFFLGEGHS